MNQLTYLLYILSETISQPIFKLFDENNLDVLTKPDLTIENFLSTTHLTPEHKNKFLSLVNNHTKTEYENSLSKHNINAFNFLDKDYPNLLKQIHDGPLILYVRGSLPKQTVNLAIIGSRRKTHYGTRACKQILKVLSNQNLSIVSGLAYGIDAESHLGAIENHLHTVAVLATGLDDNSLYPKANYKLAQQILQSGGALVSEYPPFTPALPYRFVARNRIIAGLSDAVLVIECKEKSGALITTDFALDYNRNVFAVPGDIFLNQSMGPNHLIKQGGSIITQPEDILEYLNLKPKTSSTQNSLSFSSEEQSVLKCMQTESITFESLLFQTKLASHQLQSLLSYLEIKGAITQVGHQQYQKSSS